MQRLSRPLPTCGPSSPSKSIWPRLRSQPPPLSLPLALSLSQTLHVNARTISNRARRPWPRKIRQIPMRNTYPVYDLSGLILDLDAEGNEQVRKYDPIPDGVPDRVRTVHNYEQVALAKRVQKFESEYHRDSERFSKASAKEYIPWHVSDLDIMSCALLGPSLKEGPQQHVQVESSRTDGTASTTFEEIAVSVHNVHRWNGIPRHAQEDTARGIPYLMQRQKKHIKAAADVNVGLLLRRLDKCGNLTELRRVVQILLARPGGCKLVKSYSRNIADRCQILELKASRNELKELLAFLNDVTIRLASEKLPTSPHIAGMGLRIAASYGAFSAMQMYFAAIGSWRSESAASYVNTALSRALLFLASQPRHEKDQPGVQETRALRVAAYTTLTGYSMHGHNFEMSYQKAIRTRPEEPLRHHRHFLHMLGELGAFRTIWHILQRSTRGDAPFIPEHYSDWFVAAILRALGNVRNGRITFALEALEHATGDYEADCKLDLQTVMSSSINTGKFPGLRENASPDDEPSVLHEGLGLEEDTQQLRLDILIALRLHSPSEAMSRLMEIIHKPASS
ncbi:hypothetical protein PG993_001750 [Apiospora rasikravindrae]|uniref:Uncharacterized protein n=1 Tax=Apiospora rasikravindrae TaxID=990691 RepID=A0ABR1UF12_9PEZI